MPSFADETKAPLKNSEILDKNSNLIYLKGENKSKGSVKEKKFVFLVSGTLNFGQVTYYPYTPVEGDPSIYTTAFGPNPAKSYDLSYGFGISIEDLKLLSQLRNLFA